MIAKTFDIRFSKNRLLNDPVAAEHDTTPVAVAIAWLLRRPTVSSVIIGPKSVAQLKDNLAGAEFPS